MVAGALKIGQMLPDRVLVDVEGVLKIITLLNISLLLIAVN